MTTDATPDISLIIPFLNEADNISRLVSALNACLPSLKPTVEVIFVDDGSTDPSVEQLQRAEYGDYAVKIISLSKNYGSHAALRAGILHSMGRRITFLPADLQDPVDLIGDLYRTSEQGYDIVWAARERVNTGLVEQLFSQLYAWLMRKCAVPSYPRKGFDIVMFTDKVRNVLNQHIEANSSIFLQILNVGFRGTAITYQKQARTYGRSKWTLAKKIKLLIDSFVAFSYLPIRLVSLMGITLALAGFLWAVYIVLRAILLQDLNPGWPALVAILMIGFGMTNISLGIIAEYLWRTLDAARHRDVFIIDNIITVTAGSPSGPMPEQ